MNPQTEPAPSPKPGGSRGYNLIEVLIAAGLLATVLLSIITLFVMGGHRIRAGRLMTKATANGMDVMEEYRQMPFEKAFRVINGKCASPCDTTKTWKSTDTSPSTAPGNNGGWASENLPPDDYKSTLLRWKTDVEEMFRGCKNCPTTGVTEITVDGFDNVPSSTQSGDTCLCLARFLRIRVTIRWTEVRNHKRNVTFETLKF